MVIAQKLYNSHDNAKMAADVDHSVCIHTTHIHAWFIYHEYIFFLPLISNFDHPLCIRVDILVHAFKV